MRAYYDDSYTHTFTAQIVERLTVDDHPAVVLDKTYFYPTGGGQPCDLGSIASVRVIDVQSRKADNAVIHVLAELLAETSDDSVFCEVDWARRFDHMQHHTGQHILSQAFVQSAGANTVGFHLSGETVTIDLDRSDLDETKIIAVEALANQIVFENRSVTAQVIDPALADGVRMRRLPEALATNGLRVVDIESFDQTACGGTHVARTGEIGMIKVVKIEKRGEKLRIEFCCGGRALGDYGERVRVTAALAADLTCPVNEMPDAVTRLRDDLKAAQRALKSAQQELMSYEVNSLLASAEHISEMRVVAAAFADRDMAALRGLATLLTQEASVIALLASYGARSQIVFARSADISLNMNGVFKAGAAVLGDLRGGGQPNLVQGGGGAADSEAINKLLQAAKAAL